MTKENTIKKHAQHGFSQFRLTNNLLQNLNKFEITPAAKLVLLYLSSCYNPKKADMFPKQKTISLKLGISERSVVRAVQELFKAGLIIIECKYTNRYKFTSKIVPQPSENEKIFNPENISEDLRQNDIKQYDNLTQHDIKPMNEHIKEPTKVNDFKILKQYAESHKAKNVTAYINWLKNNGKAEKIISEFKAKEAADKYYAKQTEETKKYIQYIQQMKSEPVSEPPKEWKELKSKLLERTAK